MFWTLEIPFKTGFTVFTEVSNTHKTGQTASKYKVITEKKMRKL
jgi:hypothetical protein